MYHPRFDIIWGIEVSQDISKGSEIFIDYGNGLDSSSPEWYFDVYWQEVEEVLESEPEEDSVLDSTDTDIAL